MYNAEEGYYTNPPRSLVFSDSLRCQRRAARARRFLGALTHHEQGWNDYQGETRGNQRGIDGSRMRSGGAARRKSTPIPFRSSLGSSKERYLRFLAALGRFDFFVVFCGFSLAASSRRFFAAQPGLLTWRPRAIPNPPAGTFSVIVEPAAMYAPSPIRPGATSAVPLPMKTLFPIDVGYLWKPS